MLHRRRMSWSLTRSGKQAEQGKPNAFPLGRAVARPTDEAVGKGCWKKRRPFCNEADSGSCNPTDCHLPHLKRGRLPTGVSSRETWVNDLNMGKQMTADFGLAGASMSSNAWLLPSNIVKSVQLCWRVFPSRRAFEMLEPIALKGARWVLRGGGGSNASFLPDNQTWRVVGNSSSAVRAKCVLIAPRWLCRRYH